MEAIQEIRFKFIDLLKTTIELTEVLEWELLANHCFSVQILSQTSSCIPNCLTLCQKLVEQEHQFLSQGITIFASQEAKTLTFCSEKDSAFFKEYPLLLVPCYYQSVYSGGFLLANPRGEWIESEILLIQKIVDQYACVQYWINKSSSTTVSSVQESTFNQSSLNIAEILSEALDSYDEPKQSLETTLRLIGKYFKIENVSLQSLFENEAQIIYQYTGNSNSKINSLLKIAILWDSQLKTELILQTSEVNRIFNADEIQFLEKISQYLSILGQQIQLNQKIEDLQVRNKSLEMTNQNKSQFLSHINHELRTPLTGILGFSRMLVEEIYGPLNDKQKQYMKGIVSSGEHLMALINDFLDISKIEANREELFLERIAVEDVCLSALSMLKTRAKEQNLELKLEIGPNVEMCIADQRQLKQILLNLLSNAIKFTEIGSVTLKVEYAQDKLIFSVIDTGIGIKPSDQAQLFQPFQQIHSHLSRKQKGTGLGLALSRKLAQLHGGDLTLTSEVGKGSCFTLNLPFQSRL
jgi:signal transduction histidine kinase